MVQAEERETDHEGRGEKGLEKLGDVDILVLVLNSPLNIFVQNATRMRPGITYIGN